MGTVFDGAADHKILQGSVARKSRKTWSCSSNQVPANYFVRYRAVYPRAGLSDAAVLRAAKPAFAAGSGGFVPRCCLAETEIGGEAAVRLVESDPDSQVMFANA